jgi:hypothetical protein
MSTQKNNLLNFTSNLITFKDVLNFLSKKQKVLQKDIYKAIQTLIDVSDKDIDIIINYLIEKKKCFFKNNYFEFKYDVNDLLVSDFKKQILIEIFSIEEIKKPILNQSKFFVENDKVIINLNSIDLKFRKYIILLQKLNFLKASVEENLFEVIDYTIARKLLNRPLKKLSLKQFKKIQKQKELMGELAEEFVLKLETKKLENTNKYPKQISHVHVAAGYDIVSYNNSGEEIYIEVKGFQNNYSFHWSENEISVSKNLSDKYYIYCVRFENNKPLEIYTKIHNPYETIIEVGKFKYKIKKDFLVKLQ